MEDKIVFSVNILDEISGRKNQAIKSFMGIMESASSIDEKDFELLRTSFLDSISGYDRAVQHLIKNVFDNNDI